MASKNASSQSISVQRFGDLSAEHTRILLPITGYEKMPLVSIEKAVEPLVDIVKEINQMVREVKQKCSSPADELTIDESFSIKLYTLEWNTKETSFYFILNNILRAADRSKLKPWFLYLKLLIFSLSKLPSLSVHVYRGVKQDLHKTHSQDSTFVWWGFSSCTTTIDVLSQSQFIGTTGPRTIFHVETHSGKNISKHSSISKENEVLLLAARQFRVVGTLHPAKDLYIIQVKEIEPPSPLLGPLEASIIPNPPTQKNQLNSTPPSYHARWKTNAMTVAGGQGEGNRRNQLNGPHGLLIDEDQIVYIVDCWNHRLVSWKMGAKTGEVLIGGNGMGNRLDQLNSPTDVILDAETDSLLISDQGNRRVMRWSHRRAEVVVDNIECLGLAMDSHGSLYISDEEKHEVRRYDKNGNKTGIVVAGGHSKGSSLNQLNSPTYLFVDDQFTLYISDSKNHRVIAWTKEAKQGMVVAGGNGQGDSLTQLSFPKGVWVHGNEHIYVVDSWNNRVMHWIKGAKEGTVIVGGHEGAQANQLSTPQGLIFDRHRHLYVADLGNQRVQRFSLC